VSRPSTNPFARPGAVPNFVPASVLAARALEAEQAAAEAGPAPPFTEATAELASQAHRRQLAKLEAEAEAEAEMAERRRAAAGSL
jgi:hypothetical protein